MNLDIFSCGLCSTAVTGGCGSVGKIDRPGLVVRFLTFTVRAIGQDSEPQIAPRTCDILKKASTRTPALFTLHNYCFHLYVWFFLTIINVWIIASPNPSTTCEEKVAYREGKRWRWHTSWRWLPRASCPQSPRHLWQTRRPRPCWHGPWTPAVCAWCSRRWRNGWQSQRCRRMRPTCPGRNLAVRPSGTPAAHTQTHSFAARPGFCNDTDPILLSS